MAQNSRALVREFARLCGLDPNRVRRLTLTADARDGILVAEVVMFPDPTGTELADFVSTADAHRDAMRLTVTEDGEPD